jgi:glutathione peroxidase
LAEVISGFMDMNRMTVSFFRKALIILLMIFFTFTGYVFVITSNTKNMTIRQRVLKAVYPAFAWWGRVAGKNSKIFSNDSLLSPPQSLYDLSVTMNNGQVMPLAAYKGKKILMVNTASNCGYTDQYDELQKLFEEYKDKLVVIGFPANDFKEQEKGTDEDIAKFCKLNYGVNFPLAKKSSVKPGPEQNPVYQWLTDKTKNGWTNKKPSWNFSKYLVNEQGILINYFDPAISPASNEIINCIKK